MLKRLVKVLLIAIGGPIACYWVGYLFSHTVITPCPFTGATYWLSVGLVGLFVNMAAVGLLLLINRIVQYIKDGR